MTPGRISKIKAKIEELGSSRTGSMHPQNQPVMNKDYTDNFLKGDTTVLKRDKAKQLQKLKQESAQFLKACIKIRKDNGF